MGRLSVRFFPPPSLKEEHTVFSPPLPLPPHGHLQVRKFVYEINCRESSFFSIFFLPSPSLRGWLKVVG